MTQEKFQVVADENLALTDYFFADIAVVRSLAGRGMTAHDVKYADALLVRSVTKVDAALLGNSTVKFVGSATIGTDQVDLGYLADEQIGFANAAGCNAQAVAEYVITAILTLRPQVVDAGQDFCLGVVGLGNVGKRLVSLALRFDWRVVGCDPAVTLKLDNEHGSQKGSFTQVSFTQLLAQSNAISVHVPITKIGAHATYHLFDAQAFAHLTPDTLLINSARGEVVSEAALLDDLACSKRQVVLDVFEHEPSISKTLLDQLAIATPHIAGYSVEGKARGTAMIHQAFCEYFAIKNDKDFRTQLPAVPCLFDPRGDFGTQLLKLLPQLYDMYADDRAVRACLNADDWVVEDQFDRLRKEYPLRREWAAYGDQVE